jgi:hypothetical protein
MKSYEQVAMNILLGRNQEETNEEQVEEAAVHPDALHVKPVKIDGQTKYKVHAVGSNFSSGIKVGEHLSDSELDDFSEMGGRIKHMKEQVKPEVEKAFPATGVKKNPPMKVVSTMPKDKERRGPMPAGSMKEEAIEDYDQLIEEKNAFEIELPEQLIFADYLKAAKMYTESYYDAVKIADYFFANNDEGLVVEAFMRSDIEDRVKMHQKAGNQATLPKYSTKDGKPYAEYTVTDKDSGKKTKYIHHGTMRRVERMN